MESFGGRCDQIAFQKGYTYVYSPLEKCAMTSSPSLYQLLTIWIFSNFAGAFIISNHQFLMLLAPCIKLEKAMAPHSSTLAWKIPWMEEPGRLQSMGSLRVGPD